MMRGLGVLELTATGVRSVTTPTCVTQAELDEAFAKCPYEQIRGLGALRHGVRAKAPMSGRLAAFSPCQIADLPVCPTPTCIDQYTAGLVAQCIAGVQANPDFNCLYTYAFASLPYCGGATGAGLAPVPGCLTPDLVTSRDYCNAHPSFDGPNATMNAVCWAAMRDPTYWARVMAAPACGTITIREPVKRTPAPPPPSPDATPTPVEVPPVVDETPVTEPEQTEAGMMGMWGILAMLAVAGGGYYMYRRYKR